MDIAIKINTYDQHLYCLECKERVELGEKYMVFYEVNNGELLEKIFHLPCCPIEDELM